MLSYFPWKQNQFSLFHWRSICCNWSTWFLCSGGRRLICSGVRLMTCWSSAFSISGVNYMMSISHFLKSQAINKISSWYENSCRDNTDWERGGWLPGPIWPGTSGGGPGRPECCVTVEFSGGPDIQDDPLSTCMELPPWLLNSDPKCWPPPCKRKRKVERVSILYTL